MRPVKTPPRLLTSGVIAEELGEPIHRVLHILATRPHIRPSARAGTLRLYSREALDLIRAEIRAMQPFRKASDG